MKIIMKDGSEAIGVGERKRKKTPGVVVSLRSNKFPVTFHCFPLHWLFVKELHQGINWILSRSS